MDTQTLILFPSFRLDVSSEQLWRDDQPIGLRPKTFAVLRYLVEHPGKLVTKDELLDAVWAGTVVSDTVLKSCIRELRVVLGDDAQSPQYIATVHRRGYRFIGEVASSQHSVVSSPPLPTQSSVLSTQSSVLVGRDAELAQLHEWLAKALNGERQLVFVTGEPGIGKTTLVDTFLSGVQRPDKESQNAKRKSQNAKVTDPRPPAPDPWLARGQCIEQYGAGEAYMPILEALGRLCHEPGGEQLITLLNHHAPTWLVQMPTLLTTTDLEALQRKVHGATRERMLREMAEAIDIITTERPLVLWLEDLHWSDVSTLELLALLARRREPARLLVLGTYRPVDVIVKEHPLRAMKQELQLHGQCQELAVRLLAEEAVGEYLAVRIDANVGAWRAVSLHDLAHTIHQRTEGNPLFMVNVVDELLTQGKIDTTPIEISTPATIREMIEQQLERLSAEEQHVLEVASVAGVEFSAAAIAAGTDVTVDEVEQRCTALARRGQFLQTDGTAKWPDGTIATRYSFLHALYQEVTYARVPMGRRVGLHQRIGERAEAAYGKRAKEIAAELAVHFERGQDYRKAVQYHGQAAQNALHRSALYETIAHATTGISLLQRLAATPERHQQELTLQMALGTALLTAKGFAAPEVGGAYARAQELCQQVGETPQLFPVLFGLELFHSMRGNLKTAREIETRLRHLAERYSDPLHLAEVHFVSGRLLFLEGELASAHPFLAHSLALCEPQHTSAHLLLYGHHPGVASAVLSALVSWLRGYPEQARSQAQAALTQAHELSHPYSLAFVLFWTADLYRVLREVQAVQVHTQELLSLSQAQGIAEGIRYGTILDGWVLTEQGQVAGGLSQIRQGLVEWQAIGTGIVRSAPLTVLAEAYGKVGQVEEGLTVLAEALSSVEKSGEYYCKAELYRLKGELLLNAERKMQNDERKTKKKGRASAPIHRSSFIIPRSAQAEAEACFLKAIKIARHQQAKSWELRASTSLARLWQSQDKKKEAHKLLAEIYHWFSEGFDTKDLQEAKVLFETLT